MAEAVPELLKQVIPVLEAVPLALTLADLKYVEMGFFQFHGQALLIEMMGIQLMETAEILCVMLRRDIFDQVQL